VKQITISRNSAEFILEHLKSERAKLEKSFGDVRYRAQIKPKRLALLESLEKSIAELGEQL
jgi:hypothetical protein